METERVTRAYFYSNLWIRHRMYVSKVSTIIFIAPWSPKIQRREWNVRSTNPAKNNINITPLQWAFKQLVFQSEKSKWVYQGLISTSVLLRVYSRGCNWPILISLTHCQPMYSNLLIIQVYSVPRTIWWLTISHVARPRDVINRPTCVWHGIVFV